MFDHSLTYENFIFYFASGQLLKEGDHLVWDKDDKYAMDFVAACANIRAHIFGITQNSRFQIKCKYSLSMQLFTQGCRKCRISHPGGCKKLWREGKFLRISNIVNLETWEILRPIKFQANELNLVEFIRFLPKGLCFTSLQTSRKKGQTTLIKLWSIIAYSFQYNSCRTWSIKWSFKTTTLEIWIKQFKTCFNFCCLPLEY